MASFSTSFSPPLWQMSRYATDNNSLASFLVIQWNCSPPYPHDLSPILRPGLAYSNTLYSASSASSPGVSYKLIYVHWNRLSGYRRLDMLLHHRACSPFLHSHSHFLVLESSFLLMFECVGSTSNHPQVSHTWLVTIPGLMRCHVFQLWCGVSSCRYYFSPETPASNSIAQVVSTKVWLSLSAAPFCWGVLGIVSSILTPHLLRYLKLLWCIFASIVRTKCLQLSVNSIFHFSFPLLEITECLEDSYTQHVSGADQEMWGNI